MWFEDQQISIPRNLLEMGIVRPDFRPPVSESLGLVPGGFFFFLKNNNNNNSEVNLRNTGLNHENG